MHSKFKSSAHFLNHSMLSYTENFCKGLNLLAQVDCCKKVMQKKDKNLSNFFLKIVIENYFVFIVNSEFECVRHYTHCSLFNVHYCIV